VLTVVAVPLALVSHNVNHSVSWDSNVCSGLYSIGVAE
jgi:hypothetical protein